MPKQIDYAPLCIGYNVNANIRDAVVGLMNASRIHAAVTHAICETERETQIHLRISVCDICKCMGCVRVLHMFR